VRFLKILIETNLFISIAAVAFMWANVLLLGLHGNSLIYLSLQVFFSTWFIYQVSRWAYFKKGAYAGAEELVVQWFKNHPRINQAFIVFSAFATGIFTLLLKPWTIVVLCIVGAISVLYPLPFLKPFGINTRLRDFPFVKIFLIAFVWSVTSVILPATENNINLLERKDILLVLAAQFVFIFFITLPFDINDKEVDKHTKIKTIPAVLGIRNSKIICLILGIIYAMLLLYIFMLENWRSISHIYLTQWTIGILWLLLLYLQYYTFTKADKVNKWMIKIVYDGSMVVYFLIVFFTLK
jgi:4-hydroxybenzoate polyprenyltransferase